jgi:hypothetical protein
LDPHTCRKWHIWTWDEGERRDEGGAWWLRGKIVSPHLGVEVSKAGHNSESPVSFYEFSRIQILILRYAMGTCASTCGKYIG